jgi:hypothetical protein
MPQEQVQWVLTLVAAWSKWAETAQTRQLAACVCFSLTTPSISASYTRAVTGEPKHFLAGTCASARCEGILAGMAE